jgi:iron complex transport system substrate-binding protein
MMKKTTMALIAVALILLITMSSYKVYTLNQSPSEKTQQGKVLTIVDPNGDTVNITKPVKTVVCLDSIATELVCALGCENRIVGVDTSSIFPPSMADKKQFGESYSPNVEQIIELKPDLVLAGAPLNYFNPQTSSQIEAAGIPVFICESMNPPLNDNRTTIDETCDLAIQIGLILDAQANATKLVNYMQNYENMVNERLADLTETEKPLVFYEWYTAWQTKVLPTITYVGGINIAENASEVAPIVSPEFVTQANPDVIIRMISSSTHSLTDFTIAQNEITSRPALVNTNAVKEGHVYICDYAITGGVESVIGYLQWAKWLHPDLFADIDPVAVHQQMAQEFFNTHIEGVYASQ